ncbi:MAG TPA: flavin reductase family protein [Gaiella sp.]|nr:flavin reductase family protein [Gaiella sp.]
MTARHALLAVLRRHPSGVAVVTVEANGQRVGLTVATLTSLSLEPPLVGIAIAREAALHELLREAGAFAVSLLAADQDHLAEHFARGVPPIGMWKGVAARDGELGAPLLDGALGWLECRLADEVATGTHTFFVGAVVVATEGEDGPPLLRLGGELRPVP